jgi:hypothetical protein
MTEEELAAKLLPGNDHAFKYNYVNKVKKKF